VSTASNFLNVQQNTKTISTIEHAIRIMYEETVWDK